MSKGSDELRRIERGPSPAGSKALIALCTARLEKALPQLRRVGHFTPREHLLIGCHCCGDVLAAAKAATPRHTAGHCALHLVPSYPCVYSTVIAELRPEGFSVLYNSELKDSLRQKGRAQSVTQVASDKQLLATAAQHRQTADRHSVI